MVTFKIRFSFVFFMLWLFATSCKVQKGSDAGQTNGTGLQIAVLADVHFHDVYGSFENGAYTGIPNPKNGKRAIIRTMEAQLHSTRIFNENYFAFLAALDNIVKRNVKYIILPGDFSDDGQPVHLRGFKEILDEYAKTHGLRFFLINGNHDIVEPSARKAGKNDFLGADGRPQPIMSEKVMYVSDPKVEHPVAVTPDIRNLGYLEVTNMLGEHGFFPKKQDIYWESPFSNYDYASYTFEKAKAQALLKFRKNSSKEDSYNFPDVSYLVEPVEGLWLMALDANVFVPRMNRNTDIVDFPDVGLGYNNVIEHKRYLVDWAAKVAEQADALGKTLIAFSHYPMVDFNDGASSHIKNLGIDDQMQLKRVPRKEVAQNFADAGIKIHFGGHMHLNDTGSYTSEKGNTIVNIQTPSPAAYMPGYKLVSLTGKDILDVETIVLEEVPRFNELFDLYKMEYRHRQSVGSNHVWDEGILSSKNYLEYVNWHLKELVRFRFLKGSWPKGFIDFFTGLNGKQLLVMAQGSHSSAFDELLQEIEAGNYQFTAYEKKAREKAHANELNFEDFENWSGFDFILDLYRLRGGDQLAIKEIGLDRINQYNLILDSFLGQGDLPSNTGAMGRNLKELMHIFKKFLNGEPSDHIKVDLSTGQIHARN